MVLERGPKLAALPSPQSLQGMQIIGSHSIPTVSETPGGGPSSLFLQALQVTQVRELLLWEKPSPQPEHIKSKGGFLLTRWKTMSLIRNLTHIAHRKWKPLKIQDLDNKM